MPTRSDLELFRRMARAANVAGRSDLGTYLSRLRRPLPTPKAPDMSLDSPLFRQMYAADVANDQLLKGRTANLRNSGGDFARIAGQYADAQNQAARAARDMPFLDRALTLEDDSPLQFFIPTAAAGLTAGGVGMALTSAMEDRRLREVEADEANRLARSRVATDQEIRAAQAALLPDSLEQMEADFDPVATQVFALPDDSFEYTDDVPDVSPEIAQEMDDLYNPAYMRRVRTPYLPMSALKAVYDPPALPETMDFEAPSVLPDPDDEHRRATAAAARAFIDEASDTPWLGHGGQSFSPPTDDERKQVFRAYSGLPDRYFDMHTGELRSEEDQRLADAYQRPLGPRQGAPMPAAAYPVPVDPRIRPRNRAPLPRSAIAPVEGVWHPQ